jgi:hypothetical protein
LLDNEFECGCVNEESWRRAGRVVKNGSDIDILDLIEWIHSLDTICVQFMENETDSGTS